MRHFCYKMHFVGGPIKQAAVCEEAGDHVLGQ